MTPAEVAAMFTVPYVLKRGIIIDGHPNHKGRRYPSVTIAAPVVINGKPGVVGVVVKQTGKNRYSAHRILMPDGTEFVLEENKKTEPTGAGVTRDNSGQRSAISPVSNKTVPQKTGSGNQNHSEELTDYANITPQSVTQTHTPAEIDHGKQTFNDIAFSLEFASDLQAKQRKKLAETKAFDINTIFEDAVRKTNQMVQTMIQYKEILPTDKVGKVLVKNGSYDYSVENTTICLRTLAYNQFVDMVQDKLDRPLTQMESFLVSQKLYDIAVDPQCLYCYVSLDRKAYNEFLNRYIDDRDDAIRKYEAAGKPDIKTITKTSPLFEDFLHGRKATDNMLGRYRSWIQAYNNGEHLLTKSDIKTDMKRSGITI